MKNLQDTLIHAGRPIEPDGRHVNWPIELGSTMVFDTLATFEAARDQRYDSQSLYYGRYGNEAVFALESALAQLDGAAGVTLTASGVSAITSVLLHFARPHTRLLLADNVYGNTRAFCLSVLARLGVETVLFNPMEDVVPLLGADVCAIMFEAPGSGSFEVCDIPAITAAARAAGVPTIFDNTWASPLFCQPLKLGCDVVVYSGSKHLCGHSDAMLGVIATGPDLHMPVRKTMMALGEKPGAQEVFLALRGLRTLGLRMARQEQAGREMATWLAEQPAIARVLHPAFETCPGHANWKRDFSGSCALFAVILHPEAAPHVRDFVDGLGCFGIGVSWGGYESLVLPMAPERALMPDQSGPLLRFSIGFDSTESLKADLARMLPVLGL